ncbi:hypothetical protein [uncultured Amaricoccus sp.]|uniref:hypothetical protein n=1 Tax=uncultured Amaricoccus sp. TaxID=339341 RepID=UPI002633FF0C|nr:hypothetical protein [uncultured Amaricoccus sp.]
MTKKRPREYRRPFTRDDDTDAEIIYTLTPYYPAKGPSWNDPGYPAEGENIEDLAAYADGVEIELTPAEAARAEAEIYALPSEPDDCDDCRD